MVVQYRYNDTRLIQAALDSIKAELDRVNFNKHQKEMPSPFNNTGVSYSNQTFSVVAYDWNDNTHPNFTYKDLKVWWYKHSNRDVCAECGHRLTYDDLNNMILECCKSIAYDWEVDNEE